MEEKLNLSTIHKPTWCPGCGNFGIWQALKDTVNKLGVNPNEVVAVYDIGCNSNMMNWSPVTAFESLHGRTLPVATGIKLANPKLTVLAIAGDGGCYGEGGNHLIHAAKRNLDITLLVHDNQIYALTAGQTSPTSEKGFKTKSTPDGSIDEKLNPLALALAAGATFIARGFAGDLPHLTDLLRQAINHKGFAIVDIMQPCVSFNPINTFDWYKSRVYKLNELQYNITDKLSAFAKALEWPAITKDSKIPIGILYQKEAASVNNKDLKTDNNKLNFDGLIQEFL
ncbi:MAG: thiamine pyrophosphate-dependent enzyme [Candidatus Gottesmanbacteria bacterium]